MSTLSKSFTRTNLFEKYHRFRDTFENQKKKKIKIVVTSNNVDVIANLSPKITGTNWMSSAGVYEDIMPKMGFILNREILHGKNQENKKPNINCTRSTCKNL